MGRIRNRKTGQKVHCSGRVSATYGTKICSTALTRQGSALALFLDTEDQEHQRLAKGQLLYK